MVQRYETFLSLASCLCMAWSQPPQATIWASSKSPCFEGRRCVKTSFLLRASWAAVKVASSMRGWCLPGYQPPFQRTWPM
ncbi:hypothetical protein D3C86_2056220 [compost metagenome]